jgi:hypothetical protein
MLLTTNSKAAARPLGSKGTKSLSPAVPSVGHVSLAPSRLVCRFKDATSAKDVAVDAPSWRR